jgi:hypothetical protein
MQNTDTQNHNPVEPSGNTTNEPATLKEDKNENFKPVEERADEDVARAPDEEASQEELREKGLDLGRNRTQ